MNEVEHSKFAGCFASLPMSKFAQVAGTCLCLPIEQLFMSYDCDLSLVGTFPLHEH